MLFHATRQDNHRCTIHPRTALKQAFQMSGRRDPDRPYSVRATRKAMAKGRREDLAFGRWYSKGTDMTSKDEEQDRDSCYIVVALI